MPKIPIPVGGGGLVGHTIDRHAFKFKRHCLLSISYPAPSGAPIDVSVSALSESSIVIQWSPPEQFEQNGPIDGYEVILIYGNRTRKMYRLGSGTFNIQIEGIIDGVKGTTAISFRCA